MTELEEARQIIDQLAEIGDRLKIQDKRLVESYRSYFARRGDTAVFGKYRMAILRDTFNTYFHPELVKKFLPADAPLIRKQSKSKRQRTDSKRTDSKRTVTEKDFKIMAKVKLADIFPSKWLSAADIEGGELLVTIANPALSYEKLKSMNSDGFEEKAVLHFRTPRGAKPIKPMVLNKVNLTTLIVLFGDDDEDWAGKQVYIGVEMVPVGKEVKPGLRIRTRQPEVARPAKTPAQTNTARRTNHPDEYADDPYEGGEFNDDPDLAA